MEAWRVVWRRGFVPQLTVEQLTALRDALASDDARLMQGNTVLTSGGIVKGACAIGYCIWGGRASVYRDVIESTFADMCAVSGVLLREYFACRHFLNWWDETPRAEAIAAMLPEVELAISGKAAS